MESAWSHFVYTNAFFGRLRSRGFQIIASSPGVPDRVVDSILSQLPPDPDFRSSGSAAIFRVLRPIPKTTVFVRTQFSGDEITRNSEAPRPKNYLSHCLVCHQKSPTWQEYLAVTRFSWISSATFFEVPEASRSEIALQPPNIDNLSKKSLDEVSIQPDKRHLGVLSQLVHLDENDLCRPITCEYLSSEEAFIVFLEALARLCETSASAVVLQRASAQIKSHVGFGNSEMKHPKLFLDGKLIRESDYDHNSIAGSLSILHPFELHEIYESISLKVEKSSIGQSIEQRAANLLSPSPIWDSVGIAVACEFIAKGVNCGSLGNLFRSRLNDIGFLKALETDVVGGGNLVESILRGIDFYDFFGMTSKTASDFDAGELPGLHLAMALLGVSGERCTKEAPSQRIEESSSILEALRGSHKILGEIKTVIILRKLNQNERVSDKLLWSVFEFSIQFSDGSSYHVYIRDLVEAFLRQNGIQRFSEVFSDWVSNILLRLHGADNLDPVKIGCVLSVVVNGIASSNGKNPEVRTFSKRQPEVGSRLLRWFGAWPRNGEGE
ncbi:hypothetical protein [Puniceibacterium sp. IMCC21224]|uniref:GAP1-N2 domain-containing protein n=1 Tax=Puniceibacterium sp. IMCC21224 TaxID=1618204 RepID=UPI00065CCEA0|nr:hypothetical protein [Puniceibacterium sp. IMCC21224]KMK66000.1 hypothetical protein IMCC21224_11845 [Puniceibacterium sp. IMCC21224]